MTPTLTPRRGHFKVGPHSLIQLVLWTVVAFGLIYAAVAMFAEFVVTWPDGAVFGSPVLLAQILAGVWLLRHWWLDRQTQVDVLGLAQSLVENGMLVSGKVRFWSRSRVAIDYKVPGGEGMTLEYRCATRYKAAELWSLGQVPVLIDPTQPEDAFCPAVVDIDWSSGDADSGERPAPEDDRPEQLESPLTQSTFESFVFRLKPFYETVKRSKLLQLLDKLEGLTAKRPPLAFVSVNPKGLFLDVEGTKDDFELLWDESFTIHLSARLVGHGQVELACELQPLLGLAELGAEERVGRKSLEVRTLLPTSWVSREVPLKYSTAPWIERRDFVRLWPRLLSHAQLSSGFDPNLLNLVRVENNTGAAHG